MALGLKLGSCFVGLIAIAAMVVLSTLPAAAGAAQRLILKDGTYQSIAKYEVKGERVRYMSSDREEWEELPKDLVDWKATEAFNAGRTSTTNTDSPEARELDKKLEVELKAEEARSPEVAPGLRLPAEGGVLLLDSFKGDQELVEISQNGGELNHNTGKNILRGALNPAASQKQSVEIAGLHAFVQSHQARPVIFVGPPPDDANASSDPGAKLTAAHQPSPEQSSERFRIVRAEVKKQNRIIGNIKIAIYGKVTQEEKFVQTKAESLTGGWLKLEPVSDLVAGEYAVVEILGKEGMNLFVWDFGVNPNAPANPSAWKSLAPKQPTKAAEPPKLDRRN